MTELEQENSLKDEVSNASGNPGNRVRIQDNVLCIDNFRNADFEVVDCFSETPDDCKENLLSDCLKIGSAAIRFSGTTSTTDFIEVRLERIERELVERMSDIKTAILGEVQSKFGKQGEISEYLSKTLGEKGLVANLLDPARIDSPINKLSSDLKSWIIEVTQLIGKQKALDEARNFGPPKGLAFEEYADGILNQIVKNTKGDSYETVANQAGSLGRSKKGDRILRIGQANNAIVAIEFKDVASVSSAEVHRIAQETKQNRQAEYVIIVVKNSSALPSSIGLIDEYEDHAVLGLISEVGEGRIEVHQELLAMALHLARIRVIFKMRQGDATNLNLGLLKEKLEKIHARIQGLNKISAHVANCREQLSLIESCGRSAKTEIELELASLQSILKTIDCRFSVPVEVS